MQIIFNINYSVLNAASVLMLMANITKMNLPLKAEMVSSFAYEVVNYTQQVVYTI
jgi:hypothetical protein